MDRSMKHPVDEGPSTLWHSAKNSAKAGVRDMRGSVNKVLHPLLVSVPMWFLSDTLLDPAQLAGLSSIE